MGGYEVWQGVCALEGVIKCISNSSITLKGILCDFSILTLEQIIVLKELYVIFSSSHLNK